MAIVLRLVSDQPWQGILVGTGSLILTLISFAGVIAYLNKNITKNMEKTKAAIALIGSIAGSLLVMAIALRLVSDQPWQVILVGMGSLILTLISFAGVIAYLNKNITKNMEKTKAAIALIGSIAGSLLVMAIALRLVSNQPWQGILVGMGSLILTLISFAGVIAYLNKKITKNMEKTKAAIALIGDIASSVLVMRIALRRVGKEPRSRML